MKIGLGGWSIVLAAGTMLLSAAPSRADDSDIPSYRVLECKSGCAKWVDAKRSDWSVPRTFPDDRDDPFRRSAAMASTPQERKSIPPHAEAYVDLRYTITADGHVKDIVVEQVVGPQAYADQAAKDLSQWTYAPATANGKPVETTNRILRVIYKFSGTSGLARPEVATAYDKAMALYGAGKYADAIAAIKPVADLPRLSFYERGLISLALATNYWQLRDYNNALERIRDATFGYGSSLDKQAREIAVRLRIAMEARAGQYAEALAWFEVLKKTASIADGDSAQKLVDNIHLRLADPEPLSIAGNIPSGEHHVSWQHTLLRRDFAFGSIEGKLDRFTLRCDQEKIESAVSDSAEWHVPKDWSNCALDVYGAPGATFQLIEADQ